MKKYKLTKYIEAKRDKDSLEVISQRADEIYKMKMPKASVIALLKMMIEEFPDEVIGHLNSRIKLEK